MVANARTGRSVPTRSSGGGRSRTGMMKSGGGAGAGAGNSASRRACAAAGADTGSLLEWAAVGGWVAGAA